MRIQAHRLTQSVRIGGERAMDVEIEPVVAGAAFDIVDVDMHLRAVAQIEKAGQRNADDDGIAHDYTGLRRADLALRPGDRHQAHGPVEGRDVEGDLGGPATPP